MIPVIPSYLNPPENVQRYYGTLKYKGSKWVIDGEPCVVEIAKRLFPGCMSRIRGMAIFPATKRTNGDLNWLMLRYPLKVEDQPKWEQALQETVEHVQKREEILRRPQKTIPGADFNGELKPFQQEGLAHLMHNRRTLLADEMGLGKTVQALAFLSETKAYPALIVVPPHLIRNWEREIHRFINVPLFPGQMLNLFNEPDKDTIHVIKGLKPYNLPPAAIYIIHYLLLRGWKRELPEFGFRAVIFDEIQELRHRITEKYSSASLLAESCENVIGLSGTPIYNKGGEIWNVLNILEFHCLGDYESFSREWCYGYGSDTVVDPELLGDYLKREGLLLRRTKAQVLKELPPKRRVVQEIDFDTGLYGELIQGAVEKAMGYDAIQEFTERGRVKREIENETRQATGIAKAKHVAIFVRMLLDAGEKVLLFAYHHAVHDIYMDKLADYGPVKITGKETGKQKDNAVEAFMNGQTNLCLISLRAASGLNLQAANCVVFGELDWSPAIHSQGEDRAHRIGQQDSVLCYYLVSDSGTDEFIQEALGLKVSQFIGLMGDQAETQEERMIAQTAAGEHMNGVIEKLKATGQQKKAGQKSA
ncbi:MAG: DEAD/DEAH box helicase [Firmicutes bacterium]|nr:DEAD/DEAH box helicase [Bacillota bacterium]